MGVTLKKEENPWQLELGANVTKDGTDFLVWAPRHKTVSVQIVSPEEAKVPTGRPVPMAPLGRGYFGAGLAGLKGGARYYYLLDGKTLLPDPASRFQPEGVSGPSEIVDPASYGWMEEEKKSPAWKNIPLERYIIYELHTGTYTREGTFEAIIPCLPVLAGLGVTAIEIMPVSQFPGGRNWGYDAAFPFAPQNTYGGPLGLKRLVEACHINGLALVLDVVYNHLGPEGNCLPEYGYYLTEKYRTPWGAAINYDGPHSDGVRRFFIDNALYWFKEFHVDALRLDAVHGIFDESPRHIIEEMKEETDRLSLQLEKPLYLILESDRNDVRYIKPFSAGGYGADGQWNDDFHHALHVLLYGEKEGYYMDFGRPGQMEKAFSTGFVYTGEYSEFRQKSHGSPSADVYPGKFVVFSQNHDQVGNRPLGDRPALSPTPALQKLKLAAAAVILSPYVPLLFMGEEYGETAPFHYFTSHSGAELIKAVREGRAREAPVGTGAPAGTGAPDPQAEEVFLASKLDHSLKEKPLHAGLHDFYKRLIELRKEIPALADLSRKGVLVYSEKDVIIIIRKHAEDEALIGLNFSGEPADIVLPGGQWEGLIGRQGGPVGARRLELDPYGIILLRKK